MFFCPPKVEKNAQKVWRFFFFAGPTARNRAELHFCFIISYIQSSLLRSLVFDNLVQNLILSNKRSQHSFSTDLLSWEVSKVKFSMATVCNRMPESRKKVKWSRLKGQLISQCLFSVLKSSKMDQKKIRPEVS